MLYRLIVAITLFAPRAEVVAHTRVAGNPQRDVGVGGAVAALAIRNDLALRIEAEALEFLAQLRGRFEAAVGGEVVGPVAMDRTGDRARMFGADPLAEIFLVGTHVENLHARASNMLDDIAARRDHILAHGTSEV